jgi:hypothetical protein
MDSIEINGRREQLPDDFRKLYLEQMQINPKRIYTVNELIEMLRVHRDTIHLWRNIGRKTDRYGVISLGAYNIGRKLVVTGEQLIVFLFATRGN